MQEIREFLLFLKLPSTDNAACEMCAIVRQFLASQFVVEIE
jgi:hypothetical protein